MTTNLDILSGPLQLRVRLDARNGRGSSVPAAPGVAPPLALPRSGYVIGTAMGRYESVSNDLRTVLYRWPSNDGAYPAPAGNPADVWLTGPGGRADRAQEYDGRGRAVGPPVTIPAGMLVRGEVGTALVLQGPPPAQDLALWDPRGEGLAITLGPWDQEATSGSMLAWTTGSLLRLATPRGSVVQTVRGPAGDRAASLAFSPAGDRIAVVWAPQTGSVGAMTRASVAQRSELALVTTTTGPPQPVRGSQGASGPEAWSPDGRRVFFGEMSDHGSSVAVASYELGSPRAGVLHLPGVNVPEDFGPATAALVAWNAS
jgi:hypothetical protein